MYWKSNPDCRNHFMSTTFLKMCIYLQWFLKERILPAIDFLNGLYLSCSNKWNASDVCQMNGRWQVSACVLQAENRQRGHRHWKERQEKKCAVSWQLTVWVCMKRKISAKRAIVLCAPNSRALITFFSRLVKMKISCQLLPDINKYYFLVTNNSISWFK